MDASPTIGEVWVIIIICSDTVITVLTLLAAAARFLLHLVGKVGVHRVLRIRGLRATATVIFALLSGALVTHEGLEVLLAKHDMGFLTCLWLPTVTFVAFGRRLAASILVQETTPALVSPAAVAASPVRSVGILRAKVS